MAGAPSLFYTYAMTESGLNHVAVSVYATQAAADAAALAAGADVFANQGARLITHDWHPGILWDVSAGAWRESNASDLSAVDQEKFAARSLVDAYRERQSQLADRDGPAQYFPATMREWAHTFYAMAQRGARGVFLSDSLTAAQKIRWAQAREPSDVAASDRAAFYKRVSGAGFVASASVPTGRVLFAHPETGARWALGVAVSQTASVATMLAAETSDLSDYLNDAWIDDIGSR